MTMSFGDLLSNALHDIKKLTGKKIAILQDEIGYTFEPAISGKTIEKWRYRKMVLSADQLKALTAALLAYKHPEHQQAWASQLLQAGGLTYPTSVLDSLFPQENRKQPRPSTSASPRRPEAAAAPPLDAYRAPELTGFVGRTAELSGYMSQFHHDGIAAIYGMAGMGKTSLALALCQQIRADYTIFWHRFYDQTLSRFIRRLAGLLTHFGRYDLWEMLESARLSHAPPPDLVTSFDLLSSQLADLNIALCLDDLQFVCDLPEIERFLNRLVELARNNRLKLVITSRIAPVYLPTNRSPLGGLARTDVTTLLQQRGIPLSAPLTDELHRVTEGSGAFLTLAAVALQRSQNPADLIGRLASIENIERFLLEEVNDRLESQEQRVMEGAAILSGYPGTRDALETILNQRDVRRTLRTLADQFLLTTSEESFSRAYQLHQIVQAFYYEQPNRAKRRQLHGRAAQFYLNDEPDMFKAVFHFARAGQSEQAVQIATEHLWDMINLGYAKPLVQSLETIKDQSLEPEQQIDLWLTQGVLDQLLGDFDNAQERYQRVAQMLQTKPINKQTDELKARVCLYMGELLERRDPPEALRWVQRGIDLFVNAQEDLLQTRLLLQQGAIMITMGNSAGALESFLYSNDYLDRLPAELQGQIYKNLGAVYFNLNQLDQSIFHSEKALGLSKRLRSHHQTSRIYMNLGPAKYMSGDWAGAIADLEEALAISQRLGSYDVALALHANLGRCYVDKGDNALARHHLEQVVAQSAHIASIQLIAVTISLARLAIFNGEYKQAQYLLNKIEADAQAKNDQLSLNTIKMMQAECLVRFGDFPAAGQLIRQAKKMAQALSDQTTLANLSRLQGEIATGEGDETTAERYFRHSVELLTPIDPYQTAVTQLIWGEHLCQLGRTKRGKHLIREAQQVFARLGARREMKRAGNVLVA